LSVGPQVGKVNFAAVGVSMADWNLLPLVRAGAVRLVSLLICGVGHAVTVK